MKHYTTFSEMSDIFAMIAKTDEQIGKYLSSEVSYTNASEAYEASGFLASKASEMHKSYEAMLKARRAMNKCFMKLLVLFQADGSNYEDENLRNLAKRDYEPCRFLTAAKYEAMRLAKCIEL